MEFSIRDKQSSPAILRNQRGQGLTEYILVLVVTIILILGGVYQLNSAFRVWALNYFGNYLACLLETGELPVLSGGGGGGAGICDEIFKPFTLADGRPLVTGGTGGGGPGDGPGGDTGTGGGGSGGGTRESGRAGFAARGSGGGSFGSNRSNNWRDQSRKSSAGANPKGKVGAYTGSSETSKYGSLPNTSQQGGKSRLETRLDNRFAFDEEKEAQQKRSAPSFARKPADERTKSPKIAVRRAEIKKVGGDAPDSGFTLPDLLRWLLIAAIIIALLVFLGGQALQINKSMD